MNRLLMNAHNIVMHNLRMAHDPIGRLVEEGKLERYSGPQEWEKKLRAEILRPSLPPIYTSKNFWDVDTGKPEKSVLRRPLQDSFDLILCNLAESRKRREKEEGILVFP